ncbi:MAG: outer membrane protein assembly factor BamA, partial [Deltaproteobacteria bacterium]|nr:outer membrane protein assembly factor BamA [Deltaproteobacteria bacterium]
MPSLGRARMRAAIYCVRLPLEALPLGALLLAALLFVVAAPAMGQEAAAPQAEPVPESAAGDEASAATAPESAEQRVVLAVLPFRIHSARPLGYLTESIAELLATRMAATGRVDVVDSGDILEAMGGTLRTELADAELRQLAKRLGARAVITGSLTELAGRFSLDLRMTPAGAGRSASIVIVAQSEEELLGRLDEMAERATAAVSEGGPGTITTVEIEGAGELEGPLRGLLTAYSGLRYDPAAVRRDRARFEEHPGVASANVETERTPAGVEIRYQIVRTQAIVGPVDDAGEGLPISDILIRGNRRIEADAIRARIGSKVGEPVNRLQVSSDLKEIFYLGFFRNVQVLLDEDETGIVLIFDVEENPVVRQITISGNDNVDGDKIRDALTLTTGSTLDYPLLHNNTDRIEAIYRSEGYYLADVGFKIEELREGSVAIHFEVGENEKLQLKKVDFVGNEAFSGKQLRADFSTKLWKFWSPATSWYDHSGTYSEPLFVRDLRSVEKKYTDSGYLQVEVGEPIVDPTEDGLFITVPIREGPQFRVGRIDVSGDETVDLDALRMKLRLEEGAVFNRSHLTEDVEALERHYTDRGFYFASVQPATELSHEDQIVDVEFQVQKGPLYFIRHINIAGNTRTIDPVIRREMKVVEGQLYSARSLEISNRRVNGLGFFEDIQFEPKPTEDPAQLDLEVSVVERPTGSFSFGAGYSSQDGLVFTASLSQANLFGRGYGVNLSVDVGGSTDRYYVSLSDPYFLGSDFSLGGTFFLTRVDFDGFNQLQQGIDISLGHSLREDNTARGFLRYSYAKRRVERASNVNAAAVIFREILQGNESSSMLGVSFRSDTRNDRFAPTAGASYGANIDYSGLGGFANFLRLEGRFSWYLGAPRWMFDRSSFVFAARVGYTVPFNSLADYRFVGLQSQTQCDDGACLDAEPLTEIDTDIKLPLTERYFLGGIGTFQLRGFKARSVGPRRPILRRDRIGSQGSIFFPVGTEFESDAGVAICRDRAVGAPGGPVLEDTQGNKNGRCNSINDRNI